MKRKIVLLISIVVGLIAALLTRVYLASKEAEVQEAKDKLTRRFGEMVVLTFRRDTPAGAVLQAGDLEPRKAPAMGLKGQAISKDDIADVIGRKTLMMHRQGDVVFWSDIEGGDPAQKGLSADIKKQMRAISINCSGAAAVSGMVRPNDHVDVIGTFDFENGASKKNFVTCTILQNVLVLATGAETAKNRVKSLGGSAGYSTVTLEVTPREAEMLAFAEQLKGRLLLTLRNRNDTSFEQELPKVDFEKIRSEIEQLNLQRQQKKLTSY